MTIEIDRDFAARLKIRQLGFLAAISIFESERGHFPRSSQELGEFFGRPQWLPEGRFKHYMGELRRRQEAP